MGFLDKMLLVRVGLGMFTRVSYLMEKWWLLSSSRQVVDKGSGNSGLKLRLLVVFIIDIWSRWWVIASLSNKECSYMNLFQIKHLSIICMVRGNSCFLTLSIIVMILSMILVSAVLSGQGMPVLDWTKRMKIALGSAKGLAYLHEDCMYLFRHYLDYCTCAYWKQKHSLLNIFFCLEVLEYACDHSWVFFFFKELKSNFLAHLHNVKTGHK